MARLRNIARDVTTGAPIVVGDALIEGPDGTDLDTITVDGSTGVWDYEANGSPGRTVQTFTGGGQTKVVDGHTHGQAGFNYEGEHDLIWRLFGDGVIEGGGVSAPGGMAVTIAADSSFFNLGVLHHFYDAENATIDAADGSNDRIDIVVSELTRTSTFAGRVRVQVRKGTPAASPVAPALTDTADTHDVEICRVTVPAAAAAIVSGNISTASRPIASGPLSDGSVTTAKLADGAVTTAKIADGAVTLAKLADEVDAAFRNRPGLLPTYWVDSRLVVGTDFSSATLAQNTLYGAPILIPRATTMTGIAVERDSGSTASATGRLGLYRAGDDGLPDALVHDAGTVNLSTVGVKSVTGLSVALTPGWYWAAVCAGTFSGTLNVDWISSSVPVALFGYAAAGDVSPLWAVQGVQVGTGALPATFPAPGVASAGPNLYVQTSGT